MHKKIWSSILLGMILLMVGFQPALADGIIIPPEPPVPCRDCPPPHFPRPISQLEIKYHHVDVKIVDQIAITHVDQVFYNPNDYPVEGTYIFPLPQDAAVSDFTLWVDGKPVKGEVLDAQQARQKYEEIVRSLKDPALLEYIGQGAVQANVFPIPPKGERRIELQYQQALTADNGLVRYVYPLNTEKFSAKPLQSVRVTVDIAAGQSIRAVYSPSHTVTVEQPDERHATISYEDSSITPDADFTLYYSLGESEAFHLFSYRDPADPVDADGFFMLLLAPKPGQPSQTVSKDVLLVLDRSGSMEGEKFQQAQAALKYILRHLNPEDRFYLTTFSSNTAAYANRLRPASEADEAIAWVNHSAAAGSTDINRALLETAAVVDKERPTYLIFLTDGLPTEGIIDSQEILDNFQRAASTNLRLFAFGVGYDVDTFLLNSLTRAHHGLSAYVQPGENLDETVSSFYARISTPVLTNLSLDFGKLSTYDIYPSPLPDLFDGSQVIVVGRYRDGGTANVTLTGQVNEMLQTFPFNEQTFTTDSRDETGALAGLPRLWATRKIGYLLEQVRLDGPNQETVDQIVKLSIRYGIVTPYTSYLVTEDMPLGAANQRQLAQDTFQELQAAPNEVTGRGAVQKAAGEGALSQAEVAPPVIAAIPNEGEQEVVAQTVRMAASRTFVLSNGVWMDTAYDPDTMKTIKVAFLSPEYFQLAQSRADVGAALAQAERVIVVVDGKAYEVVGEGEQTGAVEMPSTAVPQPKASAAPTQAPAATQAPVNLPVKPVEPVTPNACLGILLPLAAVVSVKVFLRK